MNLRDWQALEAEDMEPAPLTSPIPPAIVAPPTEACPHCEADLVGDPIPESSRANFAGRTHFRRTIGIYDRGLDRTVAWRCPDCGGEWG